MPGNYPTESPRAALTHPFVLCVCLTLAVIILYIGSLRAPFVFDDFAFLSAPGMVEKYSHLMASFEPRWLPYWSLSLSVKWFGMDVFWLRLENVLLHAANTVALFFLLRGVFHAVIVREGDHGGQVPLNWHAFFGALIFAIHPVSVYGVAYIMQRSILMANLFMLLMLLVYLEGLLRGGWQWMLAAVLLYIAAVLSKEHSVLAPGVAAALTLLVRKPSAALLKQIAPYATFLALVALVLAYAAKSKGILGTIYEPSAKGILDLSLKKQGLDSLPNIYLLSILTQGELYFKYLWLWLIPNPGWMSVDMREPFALSLFSWPQTAGFLAFLIYPVVAVWLLLKQGRAGLLGLAMIYPWILFLTEFSTVRIQEPFVLYRSYLWMPGLMLGLPTVLGSLAPGRVSMVYGAICVLLVPLTLNRLDTFSSSLRLWDDAEKLVRNHPDSYGVERIYTNRGNKLFQLRRYEESVADFSKAIAAYPDDVMVYGSRGKAYYFLSRYHEAIQDFNHAIALQPDSRRLYYDRSLAYRALGDIESAEKDLRQSCALGGVCP